MALRIAFLSRYSSKLNRIAGSRHPPSDLIRRLNSCSAIVMFAMVTQKKHNVILALRNIYFFLPLIFDEA